MVLITLVSIELNSTLYFVSGTEKLLETVVLAG